MEQFNFQNLTGLKDQKVTVKVSDDIQCELTIKEIVKNSLDGDEWESFSVFLTGDDSFHLDQGTYTLSNDQFGEQALFLSPKSALEYEIVVNRQR